MKSCTKKGIKCVCCIIIVILLIVIAFGVRKIAVSKAVSETPTGNTICLEKTCFDIEIADTAETRAQGLMNRTSLDKNNGMLFVFDQPGIHAFWMKNTLIPLDIIWMNEEYQVVYIQHNAQPCVVDACLSYNPGIFADYALELNGGMASKIGMEVGDLMKPEK